MLRASCSILIKKLFEAQKINELKMQKCLKFIKSETSHKKIRNLLSMFILPERIHEKDNSDSAFIRSAVSRVSYTFGNILGKSSK